MYDATCARTSVYNNILQGTVFFTHTHKHAIAMCHNDNPQ